MHEKYEDLAARAERGELRAKPGTIKRGSAAREAARSALLEATGAASLEEATELALGRPRVGENTGPSPQVRTRVPQALKDALTAKAAREHRNESEIVREALARYVMPDRVNQ